jgi:hypothetical protein
MIRIHGRSRLAEELNTLFGSIAGNPRAGAVSGPAGLCSDVTFFKDVDPCDPTKPTS